MNNFSVYIKDNGTYDKINAIAVFPFSFGQLLDEQLDEARLVVKLSPKEHYEPLTEIKIDIEKRNSSGTVTVIESKYFVVAQDKSREFPVGKGTYTHELYLIERTKLLEGILCQSLTFTNSLGKKYNNTVSALLSVKVGQAKIDETERYREILKNEYCTPLKSKIVITNPVDLVETMDLLGKIDTYTVTIKNGDRKIVIEEHEDGWLPLSFEFKGLLFIKYEITMNFALEYCSYIIEFAIHSKENHYPLKPWTITDVINRVLDLAEPIMNGESPRYILNPVQVEKFDKIKAPEFTMTQCTLREQLKIIGGYIHAEPRLGGYDADGNYQENWIFFDEYGTGEKSSIANAPYVYKGNSTDISQYCTDIQTNASNIVNSLNYAQGVIIDPDSTNTQTLRTDSINVKLTDSTSRVATQLPIYKITKVECGLYDDDGNWLYEPKDITPYVFESHEYNSTLSSYESTYPYAKCYAIYYTQGQKGLDGLFFKPENAKDEVWSRYAITNILGTENGVENFKNLNETIEKKFATLAFRVSYLPIYDAKFSHNKQLIIPTNKRFSQIYNQSENLIETSYYGENIKGVAQRLGNVEQTRTYMLSDISQIPKAGQVLDGYVISAVTTEMMPFYIKCTVALSKDFNRISQYVGINSNKRISEVSERQAYKRDILLKDYVVVGDNDTTLLPSLTFNYAEAINQTLIPNEENPVKPITACIFTPYSKVTDEEKKTITNPIKLPVITSAFGNSILFSWQLKDNYSAGECVTQGESESGGENQIFPYWQTDYAYCDYYGRIKYIDFALLNNVSNLKLEQALTHEYKGITNSLIATQYPYLIRKDSREVLNFNYEIEFVTNRKDLIIGSAFASLNPLVNIEQRKEQAQVWFFQRRMGTFENKIDPFEQHAVGTLEIDSTGINVTFPSGYGFYSWAIVIPAYYGEAMTCEDEDGNVTNYQPILGGDIILACNKASSQYGNKTGDTIVYNFKRQIYNEI